jgi:hypothetical protein
LRRLPHTFFAKEGYTQKDFSKHFRCFNVLNVYEFVVQIILEIHSATDPSVTSRLDCIYKSLNDSNLSMAVFLEQCFSTFWASRNPFGPKTFRGTLQATKKSLRNPFGYKIKVCGCHLATNKVH